MGMPEWDGKSGGMLPELYGAVFISGRGLPGKSEGLARNNKYYYHNCPCREL
jgi:hypothetical protein